MLATACGPVWLEYKIYKAEWRIRLGRRLGQTLEGLEGRPGKQPPSSELVFAKVCPANNSCFRIIIAVIGRQLV